MLDRLNVHAIDGVDVRRDILGIVAHHLKPGAWFKAGDVGDGAFRRLAQKVNLELPGTRGARRLHGPRRRLRLLGDGLVSRSGAQLSGVEHQPPAPIVLGRHLIELGVPPGPEMGRLLKQIYERQLDGAVTSIDDGIALAKELLR